MTDWRTIRIPADVFERHRDRKEDLQLTWGEYIDGEVNDDHLEHIREQATDHIREIVREETRQALEEMAR